MKITSDIIKVGNSPRIAKGELLYKYLGCIDYTTARKICKKSRYRLLSGQELLRLYHLDILELFGRKNAIQYDHSKENFEQRMIARKSITSHAIVKTHEWKYRNSEWVFMEAG